jgi:hypothetical protein
VRPERGLKKFKKNPRYPHLRSDGMTDRHNGGTRATTKVREMKKATGHLFVPFEPDNSVCDTCGKLGTDHSSQEPTEYRQAIWDFLLKHGYVHSFYGGHDDREMSQVQEHMKECSIDWKHTTDPKAGTVSEFTDTFSDAAQVERFFGTLDCACGDIQFQDICIDDMTLGQIIWHVVKGA